MCGSFKSSLDGEKTSEDYVRKFQQEFSLKEQASDGQSGREHENEGATVPNEK